MLLIIRFCLILNFLIAAPPAFASQIWRYDMLFNNKILGEQTLQFIDAQEGGLLVQTTRVEKNGWFTHFELHSFSAELLSAEGRTLALYSRVTTNGQTWLSQLIEHNGRIEGAGWEIGKLKTQTSEQLALLEHQFLNADNSSLPLLQIKSKALLKPKDSDQRAFLKPGQTFDTSLNALPLYLKNQARIPAVLELIDNEGLQIISSPIVDLGTQQMEIGGQHYKASHIKIEKADAGTHVWLNKSNVGPAVLMIAGKSGKKKFQISLKEDQ